MGSEMCIRDRAVGKESGPYSMLLKSELELLRKQPDSYLYHEHLEENNEPIYFFQFAERAKAKGLRYLCEAQLSVMVLSNFPPEIEKAIRRVAADTINIEQYMDFVRNRTFRQTLLCHEEVMPRYHLQPRILSPFHIACSATPATPPLDLHSQDGQIFKFDGAEATLTSRVPIVKAALACLGEAWPAFLSFDDLLKRASAKLGRSSPPDAATQAHDVLSLIHI